MFIVSILKDNRNESQVCLFSNILMFTILQSLMKHGGRHSKLLFYGGFCSGVKDERLAIKANIFYYMRFLYIVKDIPCVVFQEIQRL